MSLRQPRRSVSRPTPPAVALIAAAALAGCGSGETQAPETPDFTGTYDGTWMVSMQAADGELREAECSGSVEVAAQTDTSFTGSFRVEAGGETRGEISCDRAEGRIVDGGVGSSGLTSFRLRAGDRSGSAALTGCRGQGLWQGSFTPTPSRPEKARLEAGITLDMICGSSATERRFRTQISFRGRAD